MKYIFERGKVRVRLGAVRAEIGQIYPNKFEVSLESDNLKRKYIQKYNWNKFWNIFWNIFQQNKFDRGNVRVVKGRLGAVRAGIGPIYFSPLAGSLKLESES